MIGRSSQTKGLPAPRGSGSSDGSSDGSGERGMNETKRQLFAVSPIQQVLGDARPPPCDDVDARPPCYVDPVLEVSMYVSASHVPKISSPPLLTHCPPLLTPVALLGVPHSSPG